MPLLDIVLVWNMKKGYTLIELIIVIAIIGILMLPTLKLTKSFNNILNKKMLRQIKMDPIWWTREKACLSIMGSFFVQY